jgi:hypothetical protein
MRYTICSASFVPTFVKLGQLDPQEKALPTPFIDEPSTQTKAPEPLDAAKQHVRAGKSTLSVRSVFLYVETVQGIIET